MPEYSRSLFLQCLDEWKRYPEAFRKMPPDEQASFLSRQGFASLHDLLAHVAGWWEEADGIVRDRIAGRQHPARKYDLDAFNAASLARFKDTPEAELLSWYESQRGQITETVSQLTNEWLKVRTVYAWLDGVILEHLKEHGLDAPRFLVMDTLQREWSECLPLFDGLTPEQKQTFLERQGYRRFRDLIAHIIAWWEDGIRVIGAGGDEDPCEVEDVDAFNAAAIERFGKLEEAEVFASYERTRLVLLNLVGTIPDEIISKPNVQSWLRADVIDHYYEHRY
jgi:hypothetical protein